MDDGYHLKGEVELHPIKSQVVTFQIPPGISQTSEADPFIDDVSII